MTKAGRGQVDDGEMATAAASLALLPDLHMFTYQCKGRFPREAPSILAGHTGWLASWQREAGPR